MIINSEYVEARCTIGLPVSLLSPFEQLEDLMCLRFKNSFENVFVTSKYCRRSSSLHNPYFDYHI